MGATFRLALILAVFAPGARPQTLAIRTPAGIQRVPLERAVAAAVAGEMGGVAEIEALKAMAVAARTYFRAHAGRHKKEGFDFCSTTHCQRLDFSILSGTIEKSVAETGGILLWWQGSPAIVFHSADCGGRTAAAEEIWPGLERPYLASRPDPWCTRAPAGLWSARVEWPRLEAALGLPGLRSLDILRRTPSGRVLELGSNRGPLDAERLHLAVGRTLGWNLLRSRAYEVICSAEGVEFRGRGAGHGVGFCQKGAVEMAKAGLDYEGILAHYFPGAQAGISARGMKWRVHRGGFVDVWVTAGRPPVSSEAADAAWAEARRRSSLDAQCRPAVREYPSVDLFRDATGAHGDFAAVTRGCTIHLQEPARLKGQGRLGQVLLHEMIHVLVEANREAALPEWFEEGLAEHFSGGTARPAERARVEELLRRYGRESVLRFLKTGLPQ